MNALYNKLSGAQYAILASGSYMLFFGALCKIIWKFLYALKICDYLTLTECFFPMQSIGFILLGVGMTMALKKQKGNETTLYSTALVAVIPVISTHMPFLLVTLLAMTYVHIIICVYAIKLKNKIVILFVILSYIGMLCNCFVGVATNKGVDNVALYHWIAELSHIFAEVFLLMSVRSLVKKGLNDADCFNKNK